MYITNLSSDYVRFLRRRHGVSTRSAISLIVGAGSGDTSLADGYCPSAQAMAGEDRMLLDVDLAPAAEEALNRPAPGMLFYADPGLTLHDIVQAQVSR